MQRARQNLSLRNLTEENKKIINSLGQIGSSYGEGDCFFDSIAQGLKKSNISIPINGNNEGHKKLRLLCKKFANQNKNEWKKKIEDDGDDFNQYLLNIGWDANEIEIEHKAHLTQRYCPIWGRQNIEGVFICKELGVQLHIIELYVTMEEGKLAVCHQLVDGSGSKS